MAKAAKGFVLYQEDLETLNEMLDGAQAFAVVLALGEYARSGELPEAGDLEPAGMMAFAMMKKKVDASLKNFAEISEKRANAAKSSKTSKCMQNEQMQANPSKQADTETETDTDIESDTPKKSTREKRARFVPPAVEECEKFFTENGATILQATKFHCYYSANGWKVGKGPMKDWKAAARGWILRDKEGGFSAGKRAPEPQKETMLRYSPQERKQTYSAAVIDFDGED